jgi:hypothetical protein
VAERPGRNPSLAAVEQTTGLDDVQDMIERLAPRDEAHRALRSHCQSACIELVQSHWLIVEQAQTALPPAFLGMLIFWLTVLFASLGLLAPRNRTTWCCLFVCAVSMAGAIYLILELNRPLAGAVQISPAPLQKALSVIGQVDRGPTGPGARPVDRPQARRRPGRHPSSPDGPITAVMINLFTSALL